MNAKRYSPPTLVQELVVVGARRHSIQLLAGIANLWPKFKLVVASTHSRGDGSRLPGEDLAESCLAAAFITRLPASYYKQESWPLLVYLHGSGGRGDDPRAIYPLAEVLNRAYNGEIPAVLVLPQCRPECGWRADEIRQFVDLASNRYRVDPQRVYVIGNSMGGFGAWEAAAAYPDLFAAIVPIAGGGNTSSAADLAEVPTWAFHGVNDDVVPAEQCTSLVEAIRMVGGNPQQTLYPEAGHDIRDRVFRTERMWKWLFQQNLSHRLAPARKAPL